MLVIRYRKEENEEHGFFELGVHIKENVSKPFNVWLRKLPDEKLMIDAFNEQIVNSCKFNPDKTFLIEASLYEHRERNTDKH